MKLRSLPIDDRAASAAEFALVLPLLLICLFGIIDAGIYMWTINRAEKAAQMGVRMAVVTDYLSTAVGANYQGTTCGGTTLQAGDPIPASCFSTVTCTSSGCTPGGSVTGYSTKFNVIFGRMDAFMGELQPSNVTIEYSPSGLGYAGDPNGADLAPLVTVRLSGLTYTPIATFALATMNLPEVRSSLTFEDGTGAQSN